MEVDNSTTAFIHPQICVTHCYFKLVAFTLYSYL